MLTLPEKILFVLAVLASLYAVVRVVSASSASGTRPGETDWSLIRRRLAGVLVRITTLQPLSKYASAQPVSCPDRLGLSTTCCQPGDVLQGFLPIFLLGPRRDGGLYRLLGDLLSVGVLVACWR